MKPITIFYSWQSDLPDEVCKRFVQLALDEACAVASESSGREIRIDRDTLDVPGTPPITETILGKIRDCDIFLADMSFVGRTPAGKLLPNPNVMGEYGYALSTVGHERMVLVMNAAFGAPEALPFDMRHMRHPIEFEAPEGLTKSQRAESRRRLAARLTMAIETIVRLRGARQADVAEIAREAAGDRIDKVFQWVGRTYVPIVIGEPRLQVFAAPLIESEPELTPAQAVGALHLLTPFDEGDAREGVNLSGWFRHGASKHRGDRPNREARWYGRINKNGTVDAAWTLGFRVDDDREIVVEAVAIERAIVAMAEETAATLNSIFPGSSILLSAHIDGTADLEVTGDGIPSRQPRMQGVYLGRVTIDDASGPIADSLRPLLDKLWLACGRPLGSPFFPDGTWIGGVHGGPGEPDRTGPKPGSAE